MYKSNVFSQMFGRLAQTRFPKSVQYKINQFYVNLFKIDLSEFDSLDTYPTLNALFTRELRVKRQLENTSFNLISPTDSLITELGKLKDTKALQIKGRDYSVPELLGERDCNFDDYSFLNLYLSPKDYHHYHAPCDLEILEARYFSGKLLPVNMPSLRKNHNLFIQNERVVLKVRFAYNGGIAYYVAVGALNVGKMQFLFDRSIQTNAGCGNFVRKYENPVVLHAGDEIGYFEMGSTIVLIAQANWTLSVGDVVKMGSEIATLTRD